MIGLEELNQASAPEDGVALIVEDLMLYGRPFLKIPRSALWKPGKLFAYDFTLILDLRVHHHGIFLKYLVNYGQQHRLKFFKPKGIDHDFYRKLTIRQTKAPMVVDENDEEVVENGLVLDSKTIVKARFDITIDDLFIPTLYITQRPVRYSKVTKSNLQRVLLRETRLTKKDIL